MSDIEVQNLPVGEVWPEHADHEVIYSEHGRTDYLLRSLERVNGVVSVAEYDNRPCDGDITETEVWCRDCGIPLQIPEDDA